MSRPKVSIRCVADNYAARDERVVEISDRETQSRGLISMRRVNGALKIDIYGLSENVIVQVEPGHLVERNKHAPR